ncbi:hypothetical protein GUJ93_ZPchr0012g20960 [Zizania palustris]|uniref:Uncharacterized protein n=1 Tax=Zizania palustris TaxID=103762 RepID=A0A8J5WTA1_ZIZPA|nr:hypothetical protein GUJ93_ZPchr0012g20960 [Zizania palustris]
MKTRGAETVKGPRGMSRNDRRRCPRRRRRPVPSAVSRGFRGGTAGACKGRRAKRERGGKGKRRGGGEVRVSLWLGLQRVFAGGHGHRADVVVLG